MELCTLYTEFERLTVLGACQYTNLNIPILIVNKKCILLNKKVYLSKHK